MSAKPTLDRRAFVRGAGLLCAGMWVAPAFAISEAELFPVAATRYGKVKGKTFRVGHMGDMSFEMLDEILEGLSEFVKVKA